MKHIIHKMHTEETLVDIIKYPILTDKTTRLIEDNQYSFAVDKKASKIIIKKAIEYIFQVQIKKINTCNQSEKKRRVGKFVGRKAKYKKAIITLHEGNAIDLFPAS